MQKIIGTLTDEDIKQEIINNELITGYDDSCIKQACYELRASNIYYLPQEKSERTVLNDSDYILLKPHCIVVIITMETIKLPNDMLGRILTKGSLFSLGISAVNTYADPGFQGRLGIVFQNHSNQYLKINQGARIAKIEFAKLHRPVVSPYHGQHGYETEIWPLKRELILTDNEKRADGRIKNNYDEIVYSHGSNIGDVIKNVLVLQQRMLMASAFFFIFNFILIGLCLVKNGSVSEIMTPIVSVLIGLGSNILFTIFTFALGKVNK